MKALYTSIWNNEIEITTLCKYNPETKIVYDIDDSDYDVSELDVLTDEYVTFDGVDLRKEDGVTFEY